MIDHTFVICAYGECEYLEQCVISLRKQTVKSIVKMITSTPNDRIRSMAERFDIPMIINEGEKGITQDWNFALKQVRTKYATIAHQDDIYEPEYAQILYDKMETAKKPIIGFTDYSELCDDTQRVDSKLIRIKKILLFPLKSRRLQKVRWIRRRSLSFGCAICCPSVMYCLDNIHQPVFNNHFACCEDWEAWEKLSKVKGSFVYVPKPLMSHRIHRDSVTTKTVSGSGRAKEDYEMFRRFWPEKIACLLEKKYARAEEFNKVQV